MGGESIVARSGRHFSDLLLKKWSNGSLISRAILGNRHFFENDLMGYAMRTDRYRFVVWKDYKTPDRKPIFYELFDHNRDPDETRNIAGENRELVERLMRQFDAGWQGNLPPGTG